MSKAVDYFSSKASNLGATNPKIVNSDDATNVNASNLDGLDNDDETERSQQYK